MVNRLYWRPFFLNAPFFSLFPCPTGSISFWKQVKSFRNLDTVSIPSLLTFYMATSMPVDLGAHFETTY